MTEIHMETENVREAAQQIDLLAGELYYQPGKIRNLASSLTGLWEGGRPKAFASRINRLAGIVSTEAIRLQRLAINARQEVGEWEAADQGFGSCGVPDFINFSGLGDGTSMGAASQQKSFDWFDWLSRTSDMGAQAAEGYGKLFKLSAPFFKGAGKVLPFISYGFDVASDYQDGDTGLKPWGSSGITALLDILPPLMIYKMGLAGVSIIAGDLETEGYHEQAVEIQEWVKKLDLTEYLGDAYFDFAAEYPLSALKVTLIPPLAITDRDYIRFITSRQTDLLIESGLYKAAEWNQYTADMWLDFDQMGSLPEVFHLQENFHDFIQEYGPGSQRLNSLIEE